MNSKRVIFKIYVLRDDDDNSLNLLNSATLSFLFHIFFYARGGQGGMERPNLKLQHKKHTLSEYNVAQNHFISIVAHCQFIFLLKSEHIRFLWPFDCHKKHIRLKVVSISLLLSYYFPTHQLTVLGARGILSSKRATKGKLPPDWTTSLACATLFKRFR